MGNTKQIPHKFLALVGQNIKKYRKKRDLSLEELGLEIGVSRMDVHRIEAGYNITLTTILKLSLALKISPDKLVKVSYKAPEDALELLVNASKANRKK